MILKVDIHVTAGDRRHVLPTGIRGHNVMCIVGRETILLLVTLVIQSAVKRFVVLTGMDQNAIVTQEMTLPLDTCVTVPQAQSFVLRDGMGSTVTYFVWLKMIPRDTIPATPQMAPRNAWQTGLETVVLPFVYHKMIPLVSMCAVSTGRGCVKGTGTGQRAMSIVFPEMMSMATTTAIR